MNDQTQPLKYEQLLAQSQEQRDKQEQQFLVEEGKQDLDATILSTKKSIATAERNLAAAKSASPFNAHNILTKLNELNDYKAGLAALEALRTEMF